MKIETETVVREFAPFGRYRVRILQGSKSGKRTLDIREYAKGDGFEGFTRRGIRISEVTDLGYLREVLSECLEIVPWEAKKQRKAVKRG